MKKLIVGLCLIGIFASLKPMERESTNNREIQSGQDLQNEQSVSNEMLLEYREAKKKLLTAAEQGDVSAATILRELQQRRDTCFFWEPSLVQYAKAYQKYVSLSDVQRASSQPLVFHSYVPVAESSPKQSDSTKPNSQTPPMSMPQVKSAHVQKAQKKMPASIQKALYFYKTGKTDEAKRLLNIAADKDCTQAQYQLGVLYERECNLAEARRFYQMAADKGDASAQFNLAVTLSLGRPLFGEEGYQEKTDKAKALYKLAAMQGHDKAQFLLGMIYAKEGNKTEAKNFIELAAHQGKLDAQHHLALLYEQEGNISKAKQFYTLAANRGYASAQYNLAMLYEKEGNSIQAKKWYNEALKNGDYSAEGALYNLAKRKRQLETEDETTAVEKPASPKIKREEN